jgi:Phasin protein
MAKSTRPAKKSEAKGVGSAPAARRAAPMAPGKPARSEARTEAPAARERHDPPAENAIAVSTTGQPAPAVNALAEPTTARPASPESAVGEPTMTPPAAVRAAIAEPPTALASSVDETLAGDTTALPEPVAAAAEQALATAAMPWPSRNFVEGSSRIRSEIIDFTWRETEHAFALGSAILATRSVPELLALQTEYLGETLDRTLAHTLELARLSSDMLRAGLPPLRAD